MCSAVVLPPASMGREEEGALFVFYIDFFFYSSLLLPLHLGPGDFSHLSSWPLDCLFFLDSNL